MTRLPVLVVSPSPVQRGRIVRFLGALAGVEVIGSAGNLSETFTLAEAREPELVVLSEDYRTHEDFTGIKSLFYALGARWLFIDIDGAPRPVPMIRLATGKVVAEPVLTLGMTPNSALAVISQMMAFKRGPGTAPMPKEVRRPDLGERLVVIGASTGGVDALLALLSGFPEDCPPTAIVQHTGNGFGDSLVRLLDRRCRPKVMAAEDGVTLRPGTICVAAGTSGHMILKTETTPTCYIRAGAPVSGHVPSCDVLFRSVVQIAPRVIGVLLTGMGQDGARGLLELRRAGATTIGQDQGTSVVYGMPRAAWDLGAVQVQLPITQIAAEILKVCAQPLSGRATSSPHLVAE